MLPPFRLSCGRVSLQPGFRQSYPRRWVGEGEGGAWATALRQLVLWTMETPGRGRGAKTPGRAWRAHKVHNMKWHSLSFTHSLSKLELGTSFVLGTEIDTEEKEMSIRNDVCLKKL